MNTVFLDSVGLLAQWDSSDQWHELANRAALAFVSRRARTVSTSFVFLECGNAAARRPYCGLVNDMRNELERSGRLVVPNETDWRTAWAAYGAGGMGTAGIVDQISMVVMRRLGINDVFSNDRHFKAAWFNTLF